MTTIEKPLVVIRITNHKGNKVKYERYNDGLRYPIEQPYTPTFRHAKFTLPSGKKKCERFAGDATDEQVLSGVQRRYTNFRFILNTQTLNQNG